MADVSNSHSQSPCGCSRYAKLLSSNLPPKDTFPFSLLTNVNQPLQELWKTIESCGHPLHNHLSITTTVVGLSETILELCHAACISYDLLDHASSTTTVSGTSTSKPFDGASPTIESMGIAMTVSDARSSSSASSVSSPSSSGCICSRSPMSLGKFVLQKEEESLLARQVIYAILTTLTSLLRDMYSCGPGAGGKIPLDMDPATAASTIPTLYGREVDRPVSRVLSKVLSLLGKLFSE